MKGISDAAADKVVTLEGTAKQAASGMTLIALEGLAGLVGGRRSFLFFGGVLLSLLSWLDLKEEAAAAFSGMLGKVGREKDAELDMRGVAFGDAEAAALSFAFAAALFKKGLTAESGTGCFLVVGASSTGTAMGAATAAALVKLFLLLVFGSCMAAAVAALDACFDKEGLLLRVPFLVVLLFEADFLSEGAGESLLAGELVVAGEAICAFALSNRFFAVSFCISRS